MTPLERRKLFIVRHMQLIIALYPGVLVVYGPYPSKDGRYRVVLYDGQTRQTRQFCKLYAEVKLGRRIEEPETVDHDNGHVRDDRFSNLVVRNRVDHIRLDALRRHKYKLGNCLQCGIRFRLNQYQEINLVRGHKAGPFCSRRCRGIYGTDVQYRSKKIVVNRRKSAYYNLKRVRGEIG